MTLEIMHVFSIAEQYATFLFEPHLLKYEQNNVNKNYHNNLMCPSERSGTYYSVLEKHVSFYEANIQAYAHIYYYLQSICSQFIIVTIFCFLFFFYIFFFFLRNTFCKTHDRKIKKILETNNLNTHNSLLNKL